MDYARYRPRLDLEAEKKQRHLEDQIRTLEKALLISISAVWLVATAVLVRVSL